MKKENPTTTSHQPQATLKNKLQIRRNNMSKVFFIVISVMLIGTAAQALPRSEHQTYGHLLLKTAPEKGGSKGMNPAKVGIINDWIDNPTKKLGQYRISSIQGAPKVTPLTHRHLRHNPIRVAKALSGNGTIDRAILNQARLHKIADFSTGTTGVDGWGKPTPKQVKQAKKILQFVQEHYTLPKRLPKWVDQSGPFFTARAKSIQSSSKKILKASAPLAVAPFARQTRTSKVALQEATTTGAKCLKGAGKALKVIGPLAIVVETGFRGKAAYDTEEAYKQGKITEDQRVVEHSKNAGKFIGGASGALSLGWAGAALGGCTGPAAPICTPVFGAVGAVIGGIWGEDAGAKLAQKLAENRDSIKAGYQHAKEATQKKCQQIGAFFKEHF